MTRLVRGLVVRVIEGVIKRMDATGLVGEGLASREFLQHYGFTSRPLAGAEAILLREGNHIVAVADDDRRYRVSLEDGEVAIYDHQGQRIHFKTGGEIEIVATATLTITAPTVVINTSSLDINQL